jgi:hypothetical protein
MDLSGTHAFVHHGRDRQSQSPSTIARLQTSRLYRPALLPRHATSSIARNHHAAEFHGINAHEINRWWFYRPNQ